MAAERKREPSSLGGNPFPTPLNSPKRREGSSSGTILRNGEFCDITSEHRIGGPRPLLFLPLISDHPERNLSLGGRPFDRRLFQPIMIDKLRQYNVTWSFCDFVHRRPTPDQLTSEDLTLLIVSERSQGWIPALENIREFYVSVGFNDLQVEFIEPFLYNGPTISRVPSDDRLEAAWSKEILPSIQQRLKHSRWLSIGLVRRGFGPDPSEHPVTVSITISAEPVDDDWPEKVADVNNICSKASHIDMEVDVGHGSSSRAVITGTPDEGEIPSSSYDRQLGMGRSMSTEEGPPGTFGGVVELFKAGQSRGIYGLTCHHVVGGDRGHDVNERPQEVMGRRVIAPAVDHHKRSTASYEAAIAEADDSDRASGRLAQAQAAMTHNNSAFNAHGPLGTVKACSGEGPDIYFPNTIARKDWALLALDPARQPPVNQLPVGDEVPPGYRLKLRPAHPQAHLQGSATWKILGRDDEYTVFLMGQKTGFTMVDRNDYVTAFKYPHEEKLEGFAGSTEMAFFRKRVPFAERGDSGGFLFNVRGTWLGMLFARVWRADYSVGFLESSEYIIEDIKRETGSDDVRLP